MTDLNFNIGLSFDQVLERLVEQKKKRPIGKQANEVVEFVSGLNIEPSKANLGLCKKYTEEFKDFLESEGFTGIGICGHMNETKFHCHAIVDNTHKNKKGTLI